LRAFHQTVKSDELVINKSKFFGFVLLGESRKDFLIAINNLSKQLLTCDHIAFAYRIKTKQSVDAYYNDAGEPSGTAGKPLLNILQMQNIVNSGLAVARFYGGINLGTGGLARAYTKAGMLAFNKAKFTPFIDYFEYKLLIKYNMLDNISNVINKNKGSIIEKYFDENITLKVKLTKEAFSEITNAFPMITIEPLH
jgi:uncharacterized YigZ family protein